MTTELDNYRLKELENRPWIIYVRGRLGCQVSSHMACNRSEFGTIPAISSR